MTPNNKSQNNNQKNAERKTDTPIFRSVERPSEDLSGRARTIAVCIGLFTLAISVSQFGRPSRAQQAEFLRSSAKVDALGKVSSVEPVVSKVPVARIADAKEVTPAVFVSHKYGVAWQYPRTYVLRKGANANLNLASHPAAASAFAEDGGQALATVNIPARLYPGTNFKGASLTARVNEETSAKECAQFRISDADGGAGFEFQPQRVSIGATDFVETDVEVDDESAGGRVTQEKYFHVYENDACYEFAMSVSTGTGGSAKAAVATVDPDTMFDRLREILTSVTIVPPRAAAKPSEPSLN